MGIDYIFVIKGPDTKPGQEPIDFLLSRASSMGPMLAAYASRHVSGWQGPERYCLTREDWQGFMNALRERLQLITGLADCVLSVYSFDPDVPDKIRTPGPEDWKQLAAFDRWLDRHFIGQYFPRDSSVFSLEETHFRRGVCRAYALQLWLELDPEVQEALRDPQNRIYLLVG